jgi:hypothetical protein
MRVLNRFTHLSTRRPNLYRLLFFAASMNGHTFRLPAAAAAAYASLAKPERRKA